MLKRLNPLPAGHKPKGLNHINTLGTAIPRDKARDGPAVASPFLGVRALGSDAAGTCKLPNGTDGRETVNGTSRVSYHTS